MSCHFKKDRIGKAYRSEEKISCGKIFNKLFFDHVYC